MCKQLELFLAKRGFEAKRLPYIVPKVGAYLPRGRFGMMTGCPD